MTTEPVIDRLVRLAGDDVETILDRIVRALRSDVPGYGPSEGLDEADVRAALTSYLLDVSDQIRGQPPRASAAVEAIMRQRAENGITLTDMLHSYRVGIALLWESLARLTADDAVAKDALIAATPRFFQALDRYSLAANRVYHEIAIRSARRSEQLRASLLDVVLGTNPESGSAFYNAAANLGIPRSGSFVVLEFVPLDDGAAAEVPEFEARVAEREGIESAWFRILPRAQIGLIAADPHALPGIVELLRPIAHSERYGVGISSPFSSVAGAGRGRTQAHVAACAVTAQRSVVRYDEDLLPVLLASAPEAAQTIVDRTLSTVFRLPSHLQADLLETVRTWIAQRGSVTATAAALHCHRNTVNYRLRRFEEITGRSLADNRWIAQLILALDAQDQRHRNADAP